MAEEMAIVTGKILTDPGLTQVGTFRADEASITVDIADEQAKAKINRNMQKEWLIQINPQILGKATIRDRADSVKPENVQVLESFFSMLDSTGFVATDVNLEDPEEE